MSDGEFQIKVNHRSISYDIPVIFEEDITPIEQYWLSKQIEEEYYYELMIKEL